MIKQTIYLSLSSRNKTEALWISIHPISLPFSSKVTITLNLEFITAIPFFLLLLLYVCRYIYIKIHYFAYLKVFMVLYDTYTPMQLTFFLNIIFGIYTKLIITN